jgi:tight adherence protein B
MAAALSAPAAVIGVLAGFLLMAVSVILRSRERRQALAELLEVTSAEPTEESKDAKDSGQLATRAINLAAKAVERLDRRGGLGQALERARVQLRPGEYVIVSLAFGLTAAALLLLVTHKTMISAAVLALTPLGSRALIRRRIAKRRKAFESQLPGALTLVASSLAAGHTFLRATQMMVEESPPPLSEEFSRVVAETRLGDSLVDSLARMADRLQIRDLDWVVQAIRIQQTVGGRLSDLLHTLADFIRAREEIRREVMALTAEGRISAWVLAALAPFMALAIQLVNPGYMEPMYHGLGLVVLVMSGASVALGTVIILRMVKIDI